MPSAYSTTKALFQNQLKAVHRTGLASDINSTAWNIFNVMYQDIQVWAIYGKVTTTIAGAMVPRIQFTPTGGALTPMCAASASIATDAPNTFLVTDGQLATQLAASASLGIGVLAWGGVYTQILCPGVISITTGVAMTAGAIDWTILYVPLDPRAKVVAM